jgi:uncharacterized protein YrrD
MNQRKNYCIANEFVGIPVSAEKTGAHLGRVRDWIMHATEGKVIGFILSPESGEARVIAWNDFEIHGNSIVVFSAVSSNIEKHLSSAAGGVKTIDELIGTRIVTEEGKLLGQIRHVYFNLTTRQVLYHLVESKWQRLTDGGGYLPGNLPHAYFRIGRRLIVPAKTELLRNPPVTEIRPTAQSRLLWQQTTSD